MAIFLEKLSRFLSLVLAQHENSVCSYFIIRWESTSLSGQTKVCISCFLSGNIGGGMGPLVGTFLCQSVSSLVEGICLGEFTNFLGKKYLIALIIPGFFFLFSPFFL